MNNFTYQDIPPIYDTVSSYVIIDTLSSIMNTSFHKHWSKFHVINSQSFDCPMTIRNLKLIRLNCNPIYWCQLAYQFAHEYCHFLIPKEVVHELRWFEESICALSSIFFMEQLATVWSNENILNCPGYALSIKNYIESNKQHIEIFDLNALSHADSAVWEKFSVPNGEYHRDMNRYIAIQLLPIFKEYPKLWTAVPDLCKVSGNSNLQIMFSDWKNISTSATTRGIDRISALFIPPNSN